MFIPPEAMRLSVSRPQCPWASYSRNPLFTDHHNASTENLVQGSYLFVYEPDVETVAALRSDILWVLVLIFHKTQNNATYCLASMCEDLWPKGGVLLKGKWTVTGNQGIVFLLKLVSICLAVLTIYMMISFFFSFFFFFWE